MAEERQLEGYWWLPEQPENKVGGVLTYTPTEGVRLQLFSALDDDREKFEQNAPVEFDTVLGQTTDNEKITVKDTIRSGAKIMQAGSTELMTAEHTSIEMYHGAHLVEDPQFASLRIDYPRLHGWFGKTGMESDMEDPESGNPVFIEKYQRPDSAVADLDDIEVRLVPQESCNSSFGMFQREEDASFVVKSHGDGFSFDSSWNLARTLQSFLTLACGEETHFRKMVGRLDGGFNEIEILYSRSNYDDSGGEFDINEYTFEYSDIKLRFPEVMDEWFQMSDDFSPVLSSYFATRYNSNLYVENELLSLARAIESFHRIEYSGLYVPESEFDDYYDELVASIPSEYSQSLTDHLKDGTFKYANEYSLRKRLNEIESNYGSLFRHLPVDLSDKIDPIVNARNDLTHPDTERGSPPPERLAHYVDVLSVLLEIILLKKLNIPESIIVERSSIRHRERLEIGGT